MQKLNAALEESNKKDAQMKELKSTCEKSSAEVKQLKQEIIRLQKELDEAKRLAKQQSSSGIDEPLLKPKK